MGAQVAMAGQQPAAPPTAKERIQQKEISGTVTHVGKRALSVEFSVTKDGSYEMVLPFNETTELSHVKRVEELKRGDTVRVVYEQRVMEEENHPRVLGTTAKKIILVRTAPSQALDSRETLSE